MKYRFGGTVKRHIMENTESQALKPSSGSHPSPPVSSGGAPSPPHGWATAPAAARRLLARCGRGGAEGPGPSLLTCRRRLPRRAGVAGGGRVPSAGSPQPAQPPRLPHAHLTTPPARIPPLPPQRGPLAAPGGGSREKARPIREHSRPSARRPARRSTGQELKPRSGTTSPLQAEAHNFSSHARAN